LIKKWSEILKKHKGNNFTLIELLIIVAIIGILTSLMLPALSKARYTSKLAICTSRLKQIAAAEIIYTGDNNEFYLYRSASNAGTGAWGTVFTLKDPFGGTDDRPLWEEYLDVDFLQCNLSPINPANFTLKGNEQGYNSSYSIWAGAVWDLNAPVESSMLRVNERPVFAGETFNVIASDLERRYNNATSQSSHQTAGATQLVVDSGWRMNGWQNTTEIEALSFDKAYAYDDGSVVRKMGKSRLQGVKVKVQADDPVSSDYDYLPPMP
jgi:hypothetical protein